MNDAPDRRSSSVHADAPDDAHRDRVLARVARALSRSGGFREGADGALAELSRLYASSSIGLWMLSDADTLTLIAYGAPADVGAELQQAFRETYERVCARDLTLPGPLAIAAGEPVWLGPDDARLDPELRTFVTTQPQVGGLLAVPMWSRDGVPIGCAVATFPGAPPSPDYGGVEPLTDALDLIAILVHNELLRETERTRRLYRKAAIGDVAAEVAHEVNNPLQSVLTLAEMIEGDLDADSVAGDVSLIKAEAQRAASILGNLLNFARPEEPEPELVDVERILREVARLKERPFALSRIRFELRADPRTPPAQVTPAHLRQVVHNLLGNARQAMEEDPGGGEIRTQVEPSEGGILVTVQDTGPGLSPGLVKEIFDPFFTTKREGRGTGLGLAVSRTLVEANGGWIRASNWGEPRVTGGVRGRGGAMFSIWLPEAEAVRQAGVSAGEDPGRPAVLIVDDEPVIASLLGRYLRRRGLAADETHSATEALARLGTGKSYAFALIDVRMPGMSGRELYGVVEELYPELARSVAFMSGDTVSEDVRRFLRATERPVLSKPFTLDRLDEVVDALGTQGEGGHWGAAARHAGGERRARG